MNRDLAREYREAMEEFCSLLTGRAVLGVEDAEDLYARIQAAQDRCDRMGAALYNAGHGSASPPSGTPGN
jgi:hypothetical protein